MKLSKNNKKLKNIPSLNLPAVITCRRQAPCAKCIGCTPYCMKGNLRYTNVKAAHLENLHHYQTNPQHFFDCIEWELTGGVVIYKYFRFFGVGDIVDKQFFALMVELANKCPNVNFSAMTKQFEIVNDYCTEHGGRQAVPQNLHIMFSGWDREFTESIPNPYNFPIAQIWFKNETLNPTKPKKFFECTGDCEQCLHCYHIQDGETVIMKQH